MIASVLFLSVVIGAFGTYPYLRAMRAGTVRPRIVTWSVWTILSAVLTVTALLGGHIASALLSAQGLICCALVVALGWRQGARSVSRLDLVCLIGASLGIAALFVLQNPTVSLLIAIVVDAIAFLPTFRHAWSDPSEESALCYLCSVVAAALSIAAALVQTAGMVGMIFPLYSLVANGVMVLIILAGRYYAGDGYDYLGEEA